MDGLKMLNLLLMLMLCHIWIDSVDLLEEGKSIGGREKRSISCAILSSCSTPQSRSGNPPVLRCPSDITAIADPYQTNTKVTWSEPSATDDRDGTVRPTRHGTAPGLLFSEGTTKVGYSARDKDGNMASCVFYIRVKVTRCSWPPRIPDGWRICHPSTDFVRGDDCIAGCYGGHDLIGASRFKCLDSGRWSDALPVCDKKQCPDLIPNLHGLFKCTDGFRYRSVCTYTCEDGYGVASGMSRVRVCQEDGSWRGREPRCMDTERPSFLLCPTDQVLVADRGQTSVVVTWSFPIVHDNSRETVTPLQTKGKSSGSVFDVGLHHIEFTSKDSTNNVAKPCTFKVSVKEIICHRLYPRIYQTVSCPSGYGYGSECKFGCTAGTSLVGDPSQTTVSCELTQSAGAPAYGIWSFGNRYPVCESTDTCPILQPPENGAIVCDNWYGGSVCQLKCRKGYDIPKENRDFISHELMLCGDSGDWNLMPDFPTRVPKTCQRTIPQNVILRMKVYFYFDGDCANTTIQTQIREAFISYMKSSIYGCRPDAGCVETNVKINCGESRNRRETNSEIHKEHEHRLGKRDVTDNRTEVEIHSFDITLLIKTWENSSSDEMNERVSNVLQTVVNLKDENVTVGEDAVKVYKIDTPTLTTDCSDGWVVTATGLDCTPCQKGQYHDSIGDECRTCPRGSYQDQEGSSNCSQCPHGMTTEMEGVIEISQCKPGCPPGTSSSNGVSPCTPCPRGYYQPDVGEITCLQCPNSQTTDTQGSVIITDCSDFDIQFQKSANGSSVDFVLDDDTIIENISINLWFQCSMCGRLFQLMDNTSSWFLLDVTKSPAYITLNRKEYFVDFLPISNKWYHISLVVFKTNIKLWIGGQLVLDEPATGSTYSLSSVQLGGGDFIGSISQFHVWNTEEFVGNHEIRCYSEYMGNIIQWRDFIYAGFIETFVDIPSSCDDTDDCMSCGCQNNSTCEDQLNGAKCHCVRGFTGDLCHVNINDCVDDICNNGGTCIDDVDDFFCNCLSDYSGKYCETRVVDGGWTEYGNWSICSVSCGNGTKERKRVCDNPSPDNGGKECDGSDVETEICSLDQCTVCEAILSPDNGYLNCDNTSDTIICTTGCDDGYMMDIPPLERYICGPSTFYEWNYHSEYNPYKRLPFCSKIEQATNLEVFFHGVYPDVNCTDPDIKTKFQVVAEEQIRQLVSEVDCIKSSDCKLTSAHVDTCVNEDEGRTKMSLDVEVTKIQIVLSTLPPQDINEGIEYLRRAILNLDISAVEGSFTVDILPDSYILNSTQVTAKAGCVDGSWPFDVICVPCGFGSYMKDGFCELCDVGYYTDETRQTACKPCPTGKTTQGIGSRDRSECNVDVEVISDVGATLSTGIIVAIVLAVVVLLIIGVCMARNGHKLCKRKKLDVFEIYGKHHKHTPRLAWTPTNFSK